MTKHAVVAMPPGLERRVNVAEFAKSQDNKEPPKLRRSLTSSNGDTKSPLRKSKSPRRRRLSSSRDLVQDVYDRMGVNYVRGQSSAENYNSQGPISAKSEIAKSSNVSRAYGFSTDRRPDQSLSIDTRNDGNVDDREERKSVRSTRSVKSLLSAFGGGKSVSSCKSVASHKSGASRTSFSGLEYGNTTPGGGVREEIIDCRDDCDDMDGTMSIMTLDESQWTNRKQQQSEEVSGDFRTRRAFSIKDSVTEKSQDMKTSSMDSSSLSADQNEAIDKIVEEKLQVKLAELNAIFEDKLRRLEEATNKRLEEMEKKVRASESAGFRKSKPNKCFPYEQCRL